MPPLLRLILTLRDQACRPGIRPGRNRFVLVCLSLLWLPFKASAGYYPMYASWPQPEGPGTPITLTYSYSNLLDGSLMDTFSGQPLSVADMRDAFEAAFSDYAAFLPIHFVEIGHDIGPAPETGEYDPTGLADIRIGQVAHIEGANAYAYFPVDPDTGLSGDIVFNSSRFGLDWSLTLFYAVAQHELGHSLGMGHYLNDEPSDSLFEEHEAHQDSAYGGPIFPLDQGSIDALQGVYGAGVGSVTPAPVPLPASLLLFGSGLLMLGQRSNTARG